MTRLLEREPNDPFLRYGIAMEHKKAGDHAAAIEWFDKTLEADESYCYAHYHKAQAQEEAGDEEAARATYQAGIAAAKKHNDAKALGELEAALDILG
jgi:tetratricopeptide (TPR) repeat protein